MATATEIWRRQVAEDRQLVDCQERADAAYRALSLPGAPPPLSGEGLRGYQTRVLEKLKPYSPAWKDADLRKLRDYSPTTLDVVEQQVLADAKKVGDDRTVTFAADGISLRERRVKNEAGVEMIEFHGPSPLAWMSGFMGAKRCLVGAVDSTGRRLFPEPRWR
jgi:hypothetical protein